MRQHEIDQEHLMHHALNITLASAREQELRTVVRRPERLMARLHELEKPERRAS